MLERAQAAIREFHHKAGVSDGTCGPPRLPPGDLLGKRLLLLKEEFIEVFAAAGSSSLVNLAHELADLVYVAVGVAEACGVELGPVFAEVHAANMRKVEGGVVIHPVTHKIQKPAGWFPADVAGVLARQGGVA